MRVVWHVIGKSPSIIVFSRKISLVKCPIRSSLMQIFKTLV